MGRLGIEVILCLLHIFVTSIQELPNAICKKLFRLCTKPYTHKHPWAIHYFPFDTHLMQSESLVIVLRETWTVCCMVENPKFLFFRCSRSCCFSEIKYSHDANQFSLPLFLGLTVNSQFRCSTTQIEGTLLKNY